MIRPQDLSAHCSTRAGVLLGGPEPTIVSSSLQRGPHTNLSNGSVPVAVNVTGDPTSPSAVAVRVFVPAVGPSVQLPTVAMPEALVLGLSAVIEPPPEATANTTVISPTGFPSMSVTSTDGGLDTSVPAAADCPFPPLAPMPAAGPAVRLILELALRRPGEEKVRVFSPTGPRERQFLEGCSAQGIRRNTRDPDDRALPRGNSHGDFGPDLYHRIPIRIG